jgi:hypothetical protein
MIKITNRKVERATARENEKDRSGVSEMDGLEGGRR